MPITAAAALAGRILFEVGMVATKTHLKRHNTLQQHGIKFLIPSYGVRVVCNGKLCVSWHPAADQGSASPAERLCNLHFAVVYALLGAQRLDGAPAAA